VALAAGIALTGLLWMASNLPTILARAAVRPPRSCSLAAIRPLGLVVSAFASFQIAALGTHETRWIEALIVGSCLTLGCALLFPYVLGLPMPLFPRFLIQ
jgi:hypothetical protein